MGLMAAQETTVPMDDAALMESALAPEPAREAPVTETKQDAEQPRDEHGRFAPKEPAKEEPAPVEAKAEPQQPQADTKADQDGQVPPWRLREMREERDAERIARQRAEQEAGTFRQQMADMQRRLEQATKPKQEPVDFFQDPNAAFDQRLSPFQEQFQSLERKLLMRASRAEAMSEHGRDVVKAAEEAIGKAMNAGHPDMPLLRAQMLASDHPVDVAVNWHKRSSLVEKTGGDLDAYVQQQLDAKLKDPAFLAKAIELARSQAGGTNPRPQVQIPPSLSRATGTGATEALGNTAADMTDAALYAHATAKGGR